jgi:hypothetical protein
MSKVEGLISKVDSICVIMRSRGRFPARYSKFVVENVSCLKVIPYYILDFVQIFPKKLSFIEKPAGR